VVVAVTVAAVHKSYPACKSGAKRRFCTPVLSELSGIDYPDAVNEASVASLSMCQLRRQALQDVSPDWRRKEGSLKKCE